MIFTDLKYKVGDSVIVYYENRYELARIINIFTSQNDEFKYETGLISYSDLYDRIMVRVEFKNNNKITFKDNIKITIFMKDIVGKFNIVKERGDTKMGVRFKEGCGLETNNKDWITIKNNPNTKIVDYTILNDRVVMVKFEDGTTEKAVCSPKDEFDLERAIEICICKKMFGGTKKYNDAINHALRDIKNVDERKQKEKEEAERVAKKKAKYQERKLRRQEKKRQEQINIQAEAFLKAMLEYDDRVAASVMGCPDVVTH